MPPFEEFVLTDALCCAPEEYIHYFGKAMLSADKLHWFSLCLTAVQLQNKGLAVTNKEL